MSSPYLPPGTPQGTLEREFELKCVNEDCPEFDSPVYARYLYERDTGAAWLEPDGVETCPDCQQERKGA